MLSYDDMLDLSDADESLDYSDLWDLIEFDEDNSYPHVYDYDDARYDPEDDYAY